VQVASFERSRTRRADRGIARRHVVHHDKLHFVDRHLTGPYLAVGLRAPVPLLTPGGGFIAASSTVLHASLSSAFLFLRQIVISSGLGINALQSLSASGVHATRCAVVPCAKEGTGEIAADSNASDMHHRAKGIGRSIRMFWLSMFIITLASTIDADTRHHLHGRQEYALAGVRACSETSALGAFDPATVLRLPSGRYARLPGSVRFAISLGPAQTAKLAHVCPSVRSRTNANASC